MEAIKIICELKKDKKNGSWVTGVKRKHGEKFEIINCSKSHLINIKKMCDIKESKIDINDKPIGEVIADASGSIDNSELEAFALDCWNLAVNLRNDLSEANHLMEELASEKEIVIPKKTRRGKKKE